MHVTSTEAKRNLGALLEQVQSGEVVEIDVFGKPKAVLISAEKYKRLEEHLKPKPKREFGCARDILANVDVNAWLAIPIDWPEEYMPDEPGEGAPE